MASKCRILVGLLIVSFCVGVVAGCADRTQKDSGYEFGSCGIPADGPYQTGSVRSVYITMRDGVKIALDVVLPEGLPEGSKVPTILTMTRYWRSGEGEGPNSRQQFLTSRGYAVVWGDSRDKCASLGIWPHHRSRDETLDFSEIMDWIVAQPWSDGTIGGWGNSYTANTNDWFVERNHAAFKAGVSRLPDYDPHTDLQSPGGVPNAHMGSNWGGRVKEMDLNVPRSRGGREPVGVKPVDEDSGGRMWRRPLPPGDTSRRYTSRCGYSSTKMRQCPFGTASRWTGGASTLMPTRWNGRAQPFTRGPVGPMPGPPEVFFIAS